MATPPSYKINEQKYLLAGIKVDGGFYMWFNEGANRSILAKLCATLSTLGKRKRKTSPHFELGGHRYTFQVRVGPRRLAPLPGGRTRKVQRAQLTPGDHTMYDIRVRQVRVDNPDLWRAVTPIHMGSEKFATVHTRGPDVVLATDADDARGAPAIAPQTDGGVVVHVVRCAECRAAKCTAAERGARADGCVGVREGWLARRKVLHLFVAMADLFLAPATDRGGAWKSKGGVGGAARGGVAKRVFFKVDADTVPVPHNLLRLLDELDRGLGGRQPYYFGMAACRVRSFGLCHGAGGAGYGLSASALSELSRYVATAYPAFLERVDKLTYGGEDVSVAYALKKAAGVSILNVGCLYQHPPLKYQRLRAKGERWVRWPLSSTPASFHQLKDPDELRAFYGCALYDAAGRVRPAPSSLFAPLSPNRTTGTGGGQLPSERALPCADGWRASALPDASTRVQVIDHGAVSIGSDSHA